MTKDDWKKAVVTGITAGVVGAVTLLTLTLCYIKITDWYREYKRSKVNLEGVYTHCERPELLKDSAICTDNILDSLDSFE